MRTRQRRFDTQTNSVHRLPCCSSPPPSLSLLSLCAPHWLASCWLMVRGRNVSVRGFNFYPWRVVLGANCALDSHSAISCFVSPRRRVTQPSADVLFLAPRQGDTCDSIAQEAGVDASVIASMNSGMDCMFLRTRFNLEEQLNGSFGANRQCCPPNR
jgi:hypothetical protein